MTGHRIWFAALVGWLFLLCAAGPIQSFYTPDRFFLGTCHLLALLPFCWPAIGRFSPLGYFSIGLALLWSARFGWQGSFDGFALGFVLLESWLLAVTSYLSLGCARKSLEASALLSELTRLSLPHRYPNATLAGPEMEKEIRRARRYHRPLSMVTVETPDSLDLDAPELSDTARAQLSRQFALSRVAEILQKETKSTDIVSYAAGRFVMMLPETRREEAAQLVQRLKRRIRESLGCDLNVGTSSFPNEEITIYGLMERSTPRKSALLHNDNPCEFIEEPEPEHVMAEVV